MRLFRLALAVCLATLALASPAEAQRIELAGRVTASRTVLAQRRIGEPRYIAISDLFYRDRNAYVEVLDLATQRVVAIKAKRSLFERRFGGGRPGVPLAEIAAFRDGVVGLAVTEPGASHRVWYAELEAQSGKLLRSVYLASAGEGGQVQIVGAEPAGTGVWFAITERAARGRSLTLRRLDLSSFETDDEQPIALAVRAPRGSREHAVRVHAAADFSRFAVVEYVEDGVAMAPGRVIIVDKRSASGGGDPTGSAGGAGGKAPRGVDVAGDTSFGVPAPATTYGVAFAPDGKYIYLGSAQRGTIARVDLTTRRIDKQVAAPRNLHHLVVSESGTKLFALATSSTYAVYDLPDLKARTDIVHAAGIAPAMATLHGDGIASLDGAFFVVPDTEDRRALPRDRTYVIARLVE